MSAKEEFIEIFKQTITRPGADALLDYLENKSDFFTAPASARYHGAYAGGLCEHSLNVYHCLVDYLARPEYRSCTVWNTPRNPSPWCLCSTTCAKSAATSWAVAT